MKRSCVLLLLCPLLTRATSATVWHVDQQGTGDFVTIQAAIDAAQSGDEVIVDQGTYTENIDYLGKDLWIHSSLGADLTTIDGGHAGSCVTFRNHETAGAGLQGFTLTGGVGTPFESSVVGGAIFCFQASPAIRDCNLTGNAARYGAGIYVDQAYPEVSGCAFRGNIAITYGGGIAGPDSRPTIHDCLFEDNVAQTGDGTIHLALNSEITNCVFRRNQARSGAAINAGGWSAEYRIRDCIFEANRAHTEHGGAIRIHEATVQVERCLFVDNSAALDGGAIIVIDYAVPLIRACTFVGNEAGRFGGGVAIWTHSSPELSNCIIAGSPAGGGVACMDGNYPAFVCNDVWGNNGGEYVGECTDPTGMNGNISEDPLFCNPASGDYEIFEDSPCAPEHNPDCGLIGAYDVGCSSPTPVRPVTWGRLKTLYRDATR